MDINLLTGFGGLQQSHNIYSLLYSNIVAFGMEVNMSLCKIMNFLHLLRYNEHAWISQTITKVSLCFLLAKVHV